MAFTIPSNDLAQNPGVQAVWYDTDIAILVAGFSGLGVLTGCGVTAQGSPDMTVAVASGTIRLANGTVVTVTGGNLSIDAASGSNPRVDLISIAANGTKTYTAGTAAASPKPPALPTGHVGLAMVLVGTSDTAIQTAEITDKRVVVEAAAVTLTHAYAYLATDESTTSATLADMATPGPAVTITVNTKVKVTLSCDAYVLTDEKAALGMGFVGSGANTIAVADENRLVLNESGLGDGGAAASRVIYLSGLTPGSTTFTAKYQRIYTSGTPHARMRSILVECLD